MKARLSSIRITPRKLRVLADEIRGKSINQAIAFLRMSPRKRAAEALYSTLKSAVANADQKGTVDVDNLYIKTLLVEAGQAFKRFRPRAKGSASPIVKRTSHIQIVLAEK